MFLACFGHTVYCSSKCLLCCQLCLCLSAGVNVHRHADCLRLSVTCLPSPCEPAFCCFTAPFFFLHTLHSRISTYFHISIILFVGSNIICSTHTFNPPLLSKCHATWCGVITHKYVFLPCHAARPQNVNSGASFSVPAGTGTDCEAAFCLVTVSFSILSHVSAISFVSCLPESKSWEHNGPCLSLDNSHYEWEWERRERWRETEWGYRKFSSQRTVIYFFYFFWCVTFHKARCLPIYLRGERAQGVRHLLRYFSRCKVATEQL